MIQADSQLSSSSTLFGSTGGTLQQPQAPEQRISLLHRVWLVITSIPSAAAALQMMAGPIPPMPRSPRRRFG